MDTKTETNKNNRELTKTEIELAAAEIKDRLHRLLECQDMLSNSDYEGDLGYQSAELKLREKYQIPAEVRLFEEDCYSRCAKQVDRWIKPFVAGQLSEDLIELEIIGLAMEMDEYDYPWVFLGVHGNFYDTETGIDIEDADKEIIAIGSRSKNKSQSCTRYQHWYDDVLINAIVKGNWKIRGYKYNAKMHKEDTEALKELYKKAKMQSPEIYDTYFKRIDALRKVKHPLPKNWLKQVADAEELHKNNRDWQDYKRNQSPQ
jgi:hypothetical protein